MKAIKKAILSLTMAAMMMSCVSFGAAATENSCLHNHATLRETGVRGTYSTNHTLKLKDQNNIEYTEKCVMTGTDYYMSYICDDCNAIVASAGRRIKEYHSNYKCSLYSYVYIYPEDE